MFRTGEITIEVSNEFGAARILAQAGLTLVLLILGSALFLSQSWAEPASKNPTLAAAARHYAKGEYTKAVTLLKKALSHHPAGLEKQEVYFLLASAQEQIEDREDALTNFKKVSDGEILADYALFHGATNLAQLNKPEEALQWLDRLLDRSPRSSLVGETYALKAKQLEQLGNFPAALQTWEQMDRCCPERSLLPQSLSHQALLQEKLNRTDQAANLYRQINLRFPSTPEGTQAEKRLAELAQEKPPLWSRFSDQDLWQRALSWFESGRPEAARRDLNRILKEYPESTFVPKALFRLGASALATKPDAGGMQILEDFLRRYPTDPLAAEALYLLGRHFWRENQPEKSRQYLFRILSSFPGSTRFPEARLVIGRTYEEEGAAEKAREIYDQLLDITAPQEVLVEALWRLGWSLFRDRKFAEAYSAWQQGVSLTAGTSDAERFTYWQAKASEKIGAHGQALNLLQNLQEQAPFSYYGHLARYQLTRKEEIEEHWPRTKTDRDLSPPQPGSWSQHPRVRTALAFLDIGFLPQARREMDSLAKDLPEGSEVRYWLGELYSRGGFYLQAFQHLGRYLQQVPVEKKRDLPVEFWKKLYPMSFGKLVIRQASSQRLPVALLYAIIRQESAFQPKAVSGAGARGLMQLLPVTAQELLGKSRHIQPQDLFDPKTNIELGSKYLSKLIQTFNGKIPFALASYNAGEQALKRWLAHDPMEMDAFIESIPYYETRNYVKNVLRNLLNYQLIYLSHDGGTAQGGISLDKVWGE